MPPRRAAGLCFTSALPGSDRLYHRPASLYRTSPLLGYAPTRLAFATHTMPRDTKPLQN